MKKPIVIQGALQSELDYLLNCFEVKNINNIGSCVFYECIYNDYPIIIGKTKMGEICSAISTTLAIQKYNPLFILNQGTAGAFVEKLNIGDMVLGERVCYLSQFSTDENKEVDTVNPWKKEEYKTMDNEVVSYHADEKLLNMLKNLEVLKKENIYFGCIGSGDVWTKKPNQIKKYNKEFGIMCEAMECTGAYMAANTLGTPLISLRVISNNEIKNLKYDSSADELSQKLVVDILDELLRTTNNFKTK